MEGRATFFIYVRKCENHPQQILTGLWNHNADVLPAYVPVHSKTAQVNVSRLDGQMPFIDRLFKCNYPTKLNQIM